MAYEAWDNPGDFYADLAIGLLSNKPYDVELRRMLVLPPQCVTASLGVVDPRVVAQLEDRRFDQAPVVGLATTIGWGLVTRARLRELMESDRQLTEDDVDCSSAMLRILPDGPASLSVVFGCFAETAALLFVRPNEREPRQGFRRAPNKNMEVDPRSLNLAPNGETCGLIARADLNHREVQRAAYELLVDVETRLAGLVRLDYGDPWKWIEALSSEEDRARIVGHWELLRRRSIDSDPLALLGLPQLLGLAGKSQWILQRIGHKSRTKLEECLSGIVEFRNRIMHPVRPLISSVEDIEKFARVTAGLSGLLANLEDGRGAGD